MEEPLTPHTEPTGDYSFDVYVVDGARQPVAVVMCAINAGAACGYLGELRILEPELTARQRVRALVLLVREALRHAGEIGITRVRTDVPPGPMRDFARRLTGLSRADDARRGAMRFEGDLHAIRSRTLEETDANGDFRA